MAAMRSALLLLALGLMTLGSAGCGSGGSNGNAGGATHAAFAVTGRASRGASISYGSDSTTFTGHFPLHATVPLASVGYYYITAQLKNGGGHITCTLTIGPFRAVGHARSGHKVCVAKLINNYHGGWR